MAHHRISIPRPMIITTGSLGGSFLFSPIAGHRQGEAAAATADISDIQDRTAVVEKKGAA
eukprot:CAMPEP_0178717332 /NCGR_PEP_ID=MMETSP0699-20121125/21848_1 /TAXON_ID=265572 /ORGANISM="Extubocellulus spinifer, Strain CCMP396" /LENGTH=59 /DNA_ID=CAMNT_0020367121 /DNA_START=38 /DNA_END=213 /DNA_ORIENTATION=+